MSENGSTTNTTGSSSTFKRRRLSPPATDSKMSLDDDYDDNDSAPAYVPIKKRREQLINKLASRHVGAALSGLTKQEQRDKDDTEEKEREEREGKKQRGNAQTLLIEAQEVKRLKALQGKQARTSGHTQLRPVTHWHGPPSSAL